MKKKLDLKKWAWNILIAYDQAMNVLLSPILNKLVKEGGHEFGHPDETISSVFGKNVRSGTCPVCTFICRWILHPIDKNHCIKSIEEDE